MAESSDKSRGVALVLAAVLGPFGAHRFYAGRPETGIAMACTLGGLGVWWAWLDRDGLTWHDRASGTRMARMAKGAGPGQ